CFNLPHGSSTSTMQLRESDDEIYRTLYRDLELPLPPEYVAKENIETPKLPADLHHVADRQTGYDYVDEPTTLRERYVRQLQAMTGIDHMVGQLRAELKRLGLAENTVLIFTSDHGLFMGEYGLGGKAFCYEKTTHVPLIVYDPRAPANKRNKNEDALVQSIDVAPTLLAAAGIPVPESYQGKNLLPLLAGEITSVREYVFTENLWSNHFGNPRCEAIQNREWKYIRYYRNDNFSAKQKIAVAKEMGIPVNVMLYRVHDPEIAVYRSFVEGPLRGEAPVYEELFHLKTDPRERENLAADLRHAAVLKKLRQAWKRTIHAARGEGGLLVLRYTKDSEEERKQLTKPE
ncbi:MAG: sulfatase/phosphatase domain-containing protein, partial [Bacteroidota bacterium]